MPMAQVAGSEVESVARSSCCSSQRQPRGISLSMGATSASSWVAFSLVYFIMRKGNVLVEIAYKLDLGSGWWWLLALSSGYESLVGLTSASSAFRAWRVTDLRECPPEAAAGRCGMHVPAPVERRRCCTRPRSWSE